MVGKKQKQTKPRLFKGHDTSSVLNQFITSECESNFKRERERERRRRKKRVLVLIVWRAVTVPINDFYSLISMTHQMNITLKWGGGGFNQ
ncbi:hypothetical protein RJT34_19256 [Clitoria ternatea]|uniref:Uncharacterized protein n=1 Tax=Clitoria ternatea TaxID=43366 RepID=A0AAN9P3E6_CLITE